MKILVYENRKVDPTYYDASTPEKEAAAYLAVFKMLDEDWDVYWELADFDPSVAAVCEPCQKELHRLCEKGNCSCVSSDTCKQRSLQQERENRAARQHKEWHGAAKGGDSQAAKRLIRARTNYEYENVTEEEVIDPLPNSGK